MADISIALKTPNIYQRIINRDKTSNKIKKQLVMSVHFSTIVNRLLSIDKLKSNFDKASNNKHYKFVNRERENYTLINYNFIIKCFDGDNNYYYFLRRSNEVDGFIECVVVSTFIDNKKDYTKGQAYMTLLYKTLISNSTKKIE